MVNENKIESGTLFVQIATVIIIIMSYFTVRVFALLGGAICAFFLLSKVSWVQRYSLIYFLFPFASVFAFSKDSTSIFMILRLVILLAVLIYNFKKVTPTLITATMYFVIYVIIVSFSNEFRFLLRLSNIVLWMLIGYFMNSVISDKNSLPISRSLSNGTILASFTGLMRENIPGLTNQISANNITIGEEYVERFSGLFSDPNLYTILLCISLWAIYFEFSNNKISVTEFITRSLIMTAFAAITFSKSCILIISVFWIYVIVSRNKIKVINKFFIILAIVIGVTYFLFINPEWFDNMFQRFIGRDGAVNMNTITTGRFRLWGIYLEFMGQTDSWVFGNGLHYEMPYGRAAHNLPIQCIYYIGIIGSLIYINYIRKMYKVTPDNIRIVGVSNVGLFAFLSFMAIAMFLDLLFLEIFYYMLALCFIYMKKTRVVPAEDTSNMVGGVYGKN